MSIISKERVLSRLYLMQYTTRFGNQAMKHRQNIAEHSHGVAALCILVGNEVVSRLRKSASPLFLNVNKAVTMAIVHDYDETISLDLPLPLKNKLGKDIMYRIQEVVDSESDEDFKDMGLSLENHNKEKEEMTAEYQLLKVCDYLELLLWSYNNKVQLGDDYSVIVKNCKTLIQTYDLHRYSNTVMEVLESSDFKFKFQ